MCKLDECMQVLPALTDELGLSVHRVLFLRDFYLKFLIACVQACQEQVSPTRQRLFFCCLERVSRVAVSALLFNADMLCIAV